MSQSATFPRCFSPVAKPLQARFDGPRLTSDGGLVWLAEADAHDLCGVPVNAGREYGPFKLLSLEVLGLAVAFPAPGAGSRQARLGRNDEIVRVRVERFADQPFAHLGAVRIGRVDKRHP